MNFKIACTCGKQLEVSSASVGKKGRCPACKLEFVVPSPTGQVPTPGLSPRLSALPKSASSAPALGGLESAFQGLPVSAPMNAPVGNYGYASRSNNSSALILGGVVAGVVSVIVIGVIVGMKVIGSPNLNANRNMGPTDVALLDAPGHPRMYSTAELLAEYQRQEAEAKLRGEAFDSERTIDEVHGSFFDRWSSGGSLASEMEKNRQREALREAIAKAKEKAEQDKAAAEAAANYSPYGKSYQESSASTSPKIDRDEYAKSMRPYGDANYRDTRATPSHNENSGYDGGTQQTGPAWKGYENESGYSSYNGGQSSAPPPAYQGGYGGYNGGQSSAPPPANFGSGYGR